MLVGQIVMYRERMEGPLFRLSHVTWAAVIVLSTTWTSLAQDVVRLKNGRTYSGLVVEDNPERVTIDTSLAGSTVRLSFARSDLLGVERALKSPANAPERPSQEPLPNSPPDPQLPQELAQAGDPVMPLQSAGPLETDPERLAFRDAMRRALKNDAEAMRDVAGRYRAGNGTTKSSRLAFDWSRRAASLGQVDSMREVARAYAEGDGVAQSSPLAAFWNQRVRDFEAKDSRLNLSDDEREILELTSFAYIHKNVYVERAPDDAWQEALEKHASKQSTARELARSALVAGLLQQQFMGDTRATRAKINQLPAAYRDVALHGLWHGLSGEEATSFQTFRDGPGRVAENWIFEGRRKLIHEVLTEVELSAANTNCAVHATGVAADRLGLEELTVGKDVRLRLLDILGGPKVRHPDGGLFGSALCRAVEVRNTSARPLRDVVCIVRVETSGPSVALGQDQLELNALNVNTGFGNHVPEITVLYMATNLRGTSPKSCMIYVRELSPNETIQVAVGNSPVQSWVDRITVQLFAREGRVLPFDLYVAKKAAPNPR
jgi:hypothetical protein